MAIPIPHVVRQEYWKPGFRYSVTVCSDKYKTCTETVDSLLRDGFPDTKILVFCKSSQEVTQWAREYGAHQYHSALRDKQQQWASWTKGLLFGTTAIGAGLNKDGIGYVLHFGDPYTLCEGGTSEMRGWSSGT